MMSLEEHKDPRSSSRPTMQDWLDQVHTEELALLIICMRLLTRPSKDLNSEGSSFFELYNTAKKTFSSLACLSRPSIELIQCGTLLCLFEFGHGRPRLAYRTLSKTLALACIVGIKPRTYLHHNTAPISHMTYDKHNLWWSIFILDQYTSFIAVVDHSLIILQIHPYASSSSRIASRG